MQLLHTVAIAFSPRMHICTTTVGCRRTVITGKISAAATTIGLHAFGLAVHTVIVNGKAVPFQLVPYAWDQLPSALLSASGAKLEAAHQSISEDITVEYHRFLQQELQPELVCQVWQLFGSRSQKEVSLYGLWKLEATKNRREMCAAH
jgi:hypothetical protein